MKLINEGVYSGDLEDMAVRALFEMAESPQRLLSSHGRIIFAGDQVYKDEVSVEGNHGCFGK